MKKIIEKKLFAIIAIISLLGHTITMEELNTDMDLQLVFYVNEHNIDLHGYGLGKEKYGYPLLDVGTREFIYDDQEIKPYTSQFGLHGYFFTFFQNTVTYILDWWVSGDSVRIIKPYNVYKFTSMCVKILYSFLFAIVIFLISIQMQRKFGNIFAITFFLSFMISTSVTRMLGGSFWIAFTWFLPSLFTLFMLNSIEHKGNLKWAKYLPLVFLSILIRCLCGYEFLSSIMLFSISFFIFEFLRTQDRIYKKQLFMATLSIGIVSILGFVTALLLHANLQGDTLVEGLNSIYQEVVLRRTVGLEGSLTRDVTRLGILVRKYLIPISTSTSEVCSENIPASIFMFIVLFIFASKIIKKQKIEVFNIQIFLFYFITSSSWIILAKDHAENHHHLLFIVFYFGFIQSLIYIIVHYLASEYPQLNSFLKRNQLTFINSR